MPHLPAWWWLHHGMIDTSKDWGVFQDEKKQDGATHRQNPRGKPASVCFIPDTGRGIHISAGQPATQGQIYTGVSYLEDSECS